MRILVLASAIVLAGSMRGGPVATAQAPAAVTITDLGTLGTNSFATGINASGQVVGMSNLSSGARRAFLWTATGGMVNLGTLGGSESEATGINRVGTIIGGGWTTLGEWHGWRRPAGGSLVDITAADGCCTHLHGINDAGWIAGSDFLGPAPVHQLRAVIWKGPGLVQVIGEAWANAVNDRGEVVGSAAGNIGFFWSPAGGMEDVGNLGGAEATANALNNSSQVVGLSRTLTNNRAFLWKSPGPMQNLGSLGGFTSMAFDINDLGQVVGWSHTATNQQRAFLWTAAGGMQDLGTLGVASTAVSINNAGQIVGYSEFASGAIRATLWQLSPGSQVQSLQDAIQNLVSTGVLGAGQGNALLAKLAAALQQIGNGNSNPAKGQLGAFINQINALVAGGTLTAAEAQPLLDAANAVLAQL